MEKIWTGNNRAPWHDYSARCIYHLTLLKSRDVPSFGSLAGDCRLSIGTPGSSYVRASNIGRAIKESLREIPLIHKGLRLLQYSLMPDHLHILLSVEEKLDEVIGRKLAVFKVMVNKRVGMEQVFKRGFNDQILTRSRSLDVIIHYLKANPYRLAIRQACSDFFTRCNNLIIGDTPCQLYGNIHILNNPFKDQVIVHRADDERTFLTAKDNWLYTAANGGVLVSPFISPREKSVRKEAESLGGRIIQISNLPLREREKPSGKDFDLCAEGRLLIIAPQTPMSINRSACLKMNALAGAILTTYE